MIPGAEPLVSVLVPVYNGADYLRECLDSVLRQTYGNWQLVVVENCSTDGTRAIAAEYAARDPRVRLAAFDEFVGSAENFNRAQSLVPADARYVKWLCADDWLFPECLVRMVDVAERHPSVVLVSAYRVDDREVNLDGLPVDVEVVEGHEMGRAALLGELEYVFGGQSSVLYRHGTLTRTPFWATDFQHADLEFFYEALRHGDFGFVHQVLTYTRRHEGSVTSRARGTAHLLAEHVMILLKHGRYFLSAEDYERRLAVKLVLQTAQVVRRPSEWRRTPARRMRSRLDRPAVLRGIRRQLARTLRGEHTPRWQPTSSEPARSAGS